jgi:hypothetical protein
MASNLRRKIPVPVIAVVSDVLATRYTHSRIDYFMQAANIECTPPGGNKLDKTRVWLRWANENNSDPLATVGKVITEFMEVNSAGYASDISLDPEREKVNRVLRDPAIVDDDDLKAILVFLRESSGRAFRRAYGGRPAW